MTAEEIIVEVNEAFAELPRPGIPPGFVPSGRLGNPGWDAVEYHRARAFADLVPDLVKHVLEQPAKYLPRFLQDVGDSDRLRVFTPRHMRAFLQVVEFLQREHTAVVAEAGATGELEKARIKLERMLSP